MRVSRTGINPLLWVLAIVTPLALVLAEFASEGWLRIAMFVLAVAPPAVVFVAYFVLVFARPELLQSEEYRLRRDALIAFRQGASPEVLKAAAELARLDSRPAAGRKGEPK